MCCGVGKLQWSALNHHSQKPDFKGQNLTSTSCTIGAITRYKKQDLKFSFKYEKWLKEKWIKCNEKAKSTR